MEQIQTDLMKYFNSNKELIEKYDKQLQGSNNSDNEIDTKQYRENIIKKILIETFEDINIKLLETFININKIKMDNTVKDSSDNCENQIKQEFEQQSLQWQSVLKYMPYIIGDYYQNQ